MEYLKALAIKKFREDLMKKLLIKKK